MPVEYFQCPYCQPFQGGDGKQVPNSVGHFKVKIINGYILVFRCDKCYKCFRVTMRGRTLLNQDMSYNEKKAFDEDDPVVLWEDMTPSEKRAWKKKERRDHGSNK